MSVELVKQTYEAFARGDMDTVLAGFDPDIEWVEPDGYFGSIAGTHHGREAVAQALSVYPEYWQEFSIEPQEFLEADGRVVVLGVQRGVAKATGRTYEGRVANVWDVRDGKLTRLRVYTDTALMHEALGGTLVRGAPS